MSQWCSDVKGIYINETFSNRDKFISNNEKKYVDETKFKKNPSIMVNKWSVKIK